jgi:aryl-alcohol dehydrogenase-like predicted oxidoreductase
MRYKRLGNSGLQVSVIGLGGNTFGRYVDAKGTARLIHRAIDLGINFFDTADIYSLGVSEEHVGKALADRRDQGLICTKVGMKMGDRPMEKGLSRHHIIAGVEDCLKRLGTDYIDLLQVHAWDPETPLEESMQALNDLVRSGKVRYIGCSNFTAWEVVGADWLAETLGTPHFITAQNEYSLYNRSAETELVPALESVGMSLLPYFPLAYGLLTGKYRRDQAAPEGTRLAQETHRLEGADFDVIEGLQAFADDRGVSLLEVAIGGLAAQPAVGSVISGVSRAEQIAANVAAVAWEPTLEDLAAIDEIVSARPTGYTTFAF